MVWLYLGINFMPAMILILKIKNKEFDDPKLFISIIVWLVAITIFWYHMDWFTFDHDGPLFDPDFIWKN